MTDDERAAALLHLRGSTLSKGEPIALPITLASMFSLPGDPTGVRAYGREGSPTWDALEHMLGHLEDAPVVAFPSGMAAISASILSVVSAGDRILIPADGYYTTRSLADRFLKRMDVTVDTRPTASFAEGGFDGYRLVFAETPSNPGLDVCDIAAIAGAVHAAGGLLVVDNTTMTPLGQRPLDLGADVVVASDTKSPNGHSDLLLGHVATRNEALLTEVRDWRKLSGGIPGSFEAWLGHRGLETFELRYERMCATAGALATRLAGHPALLSLRYPGLPDDPSHAVASQQMRRMGFLMSLTLRDEATAERFIDACPYILSSTSFGGVHSTAERRARWGDAVAPGFVRLSVGCEPEGPLCDAVLRALDEATA